MSAETVNRFVPPVHLVIVSGPWSRFRLMCPLRQTYGFLGGALSLAKTDEFQGTR